VLLVVWELSESPLTIPAPKGYERERCGQPPEHEPAGICYCTRLAATAQRRSFVVQWGGWLVTVLGSLAGLIVALRRDPQESSSLPENAVRRAFSDKSWGVFWGATAVAITTFGQQFVNRASEGAHAAAEATRVIAWLATPGADDMRTADASGAAPAAMPTDRLAYRRCVEIKAKWLDGRSNSALLDKLSNNLGLNTSGEQ